MDDRGQISLGISRLFLSLIVGGIMIWILKLGGEPILNGAKNSTNAPAANQATQWLLQGIDWLALAFLLIGFFGIIVLAIYRRSV